MWPQPRPPSSLDGPEFRPGDALIVVDVQNDFLPGGSLAVRHGDQVVPVLNRYIELADAKGVPIFATRDWHPPDHCSFVARGGPWPPHCIAGTEGAEFAPMLLLPPHTVVVSKGSEPERDAYSGFEGTELDGMLRSMRVVRLLVGGLATDYCVLNTVRDALAKGYQTVLLTDAVRAVGMRPTDEAKAIEEMMAEGSAAAQLSMFEAASRAHAVRAPE